ncbi:MAG: hypothetical protein ACYDCL_19270 [Myxococcales bacterium]
MLVLLSSLLAFPAAGWSVAGDGVCPDPAAVRAELSRLLSAPGDLRARLEGLPDGVRVQLLDSAGRVLIDRRLPRDRSCLALAQACAVVLAAGALPFISVEHVESRPAPVPPPSVAAVPIRRPEAVPAARWILGLSAALAAGYAGSFAPDGQLLASLGGRAGRWLCQLALAAEGPRSLPLPPGSVSWQRFSASAGLARRWALGAVFLEIAARGAASALLLKGRGYTVDGSNLELDPGAELAARLLFGRGRLRPFVGVQGAAWLPSETAVVAGSAATARLPQLEGFALLGIDWQLGAHP